jgi:hypothetical protein
MNEQTKTNKTAPVNVMADDRPLRSAGWYTVQSFVGPARILRYFKSEERAREDARRKSHYGVRAVSADRLRVVEASA